ncbi:hypothetical protein BX600DRAFT_508614 [Xylariales sp. PMI_506]|nr:hypothetical protein BX600DRAFT_508614 [Xylariales sp. PMI_506]
MDAASIARANPVATGFFATVIVGLAWLGSPKLSSCSIQIGMTDIASRAGQDFLAWKSFGTGGTPPTLAGYLKMTSLRIRIRLLSSYDELDASGLSSSGPSYLKSAAGGGGSSGISSSNPLPRRAGGRAPLMPRILPQRQRPEPVDPATAARLHGLVSALAAERPDLLEVLPSHTEGRTTDGLYARADLPLDQLNAAAAGDPILRREIAHAHPAEHSLHAFLSPADARKVVEAEWGQRFSLPHVNPGWVMVYAPRNEAELEVVERIVRAAVGWVTGQEI